MQKIRKNIQQFAKVRNWDKFHSPKNLSMALASEVGELLEIFQWLKEEETMVDRINQNNLVKVKEELADIFIYLIRIADKLNIDLIAEAEKKIKMNAKKYPVKLSKGNAVKYNRRNE